METRAHEFHFNLDDAWPEDKVAFATRDLRSWGPQLRFSATARLIENFYAKISGEFPRFLLFGSGDFHHLSALWLRRIQENFTLVSFDNHPDWDWRPPRWACGGWINRALELPRLDHASVWGCGNFECWWPHQFFGNRTAERAGKLAVHPWGENRPTRRGAILHASWRENFERFVGETRGRNLYVTIDLDCLLPNESATNWENGKFAVDDLVWALGELRESARIIGGDICGAFSPPKFARRKQRIAAEWDHPKLANTDLKNAQRVNLAALHKLWPALTEGNENEAGRDQQRADR